MKALSILLVVVVGLVSNWPSRGSEPNLSITSSDHPQEWYNRTGDKLSQYLEWSRSKDHLVLHVAYANVSDTSSVWREQSYVDSFDLSFPTVRLDRSANRLYVVASHGHESTIGHLESGAFGNRVVLEHHLELSAHRHNGVIRASINSVGSPADKP